MRKVGLPGGKALGVLSLSIFQRLSRVPARTALTPLVPADYQSDREDAPVPGDAWRAEVPSDVELAPVLTCRDLVKQVCAVPYGSTVVKPEPREKPRTMTDWLTVALRTACGSWKPGRERCRGVGRTGRGC